MLVYNAICGVVPRALASVANTLVETDENNNSWASQISKTTLVAGVIILGLGIALSTANLVVFGATIIVPSTLCLLIATVAAHTLAASKEAKTKLDESLKDNKEEFAKLKGSLKGLGDQINHDPDVQLSSEGPSETDLQQIKTNYNNLMAELNACDDPVKRRELINAIRQISIVQSGEN